MILLDTHALVWLASDPDRLSTGAREAIAASADALYCSVVSTWEIALLVKRGRLSLPLGPGDFVRTAIGHHRLVEISLERSAILTAVGLDDLHNDPFDRILIAESLTRGLPLVTRDSVIPTYPGVTTVW